MSSDPITIALPREQDTSALAQKLAPVLRKGDTLLLEGQIGAGKSAFCRALIRARLGRAEDVPSPTFTLVQTYDAPDGDIWHCDLYRLTSPDEIFELGLEDAFTSAICLVEWPDRLGAETPPEALRMAFVATATGHMVTLHPTPHWRARLGVLA